MSIFNILTMIGGLSLFLFGMSLMGKALERRAGGRLKIILSKITTNRFAGFMTGCGVTAIIQSSSATTVMVVGFVNSGLLSLKQAINVIMGANVGTTITGWILSLGGIDSTNIYVRLLKPSSFTPILALIGIILFMFSKKSRKKDTGMILLGFTVLMYGMETMTEAVSSLADVPAFKELFIMFKNPLLGLLVGALLTAIIQSSSASVGILQALTVTGQVSYGAAIPIVMGDAIGTCVTALLSSVGAKKEAKRAAAVHLLINIIGASVCISLFCLIRWIFKPVLLDEAATIVGIAIVNTAFKVFTSAFLMPMTGLLEKTVYKIIPDSEEEEEKVFLDDRLLDTPSLALNQCRELTLKMSETATTALIDSMKAVTNYSPELAAAIRKAEEKCDNYEDALGTYLIKLSATRLGDDESKEAAGLLKLIGDFERLSDHAVHIICSAEELRDKMITLSESALKEYDKLSGAVTEILYKTMNALREKKLEDAMAIKPLEQVIDELKEQIRSNHIIRLQQGRCSVGAGFVWSDLLSYLERSSDHCSIIAGCLIEAYSDRHGTHKASKAARIGDPAFERLYQYYSHKFVL